MIILVINDNCKWDIYDYLSHQPFADFCCQADDFAEVCPNVFQHLHRSPHLIYIVSTMSFAHFVVLGQNSNSSGANRVYHGLPKVSCTDLTP